MLELLYRPLIILHIFTGTIALVSSLLAFSTSKWSNAHRYAGVVFFWSMLITSLASIPPALISGKLVLFLLSVFSFHLTYSGRRYLAFRRGGRAQWLDYGSSVMVLIFGLLLWGFGIPVFYQNMGIWGAIAPLLFGWVSVSMAKEDFQWFRGKDNCPKLALKRHIGRMGGATISAFTAFLVNVNFVLPGGIAWILPTLLGSFLIAYFMRKVSQNQPIR